MKRFLTTASTVIVLLAVGVLAAGCGESENEKAVAGAKDVDRAYVAASIALNERAAEMSKLVAERAQSKALKPFAAGVAGARVSETTKLKEYADALGVDTDAAITDDLLKPLGWTERDIYLDADVDELERADDADFDAVYLKLLLENCDGSIRVARPQVIKGGSDDLVAQAQKQISARSLEIEKAEKLQRRLAR